MNNQAELYTQEMIDCVIKGERSRNAKPKKHWQRRYQRVFNKPLPDNYWLYIRLDNLCTTFALNHAKHIQNQHQLFKNRGGREEFAGVTILTFTMAGRLMVTLRGTETDHYITMVFPEDGLIRGNGYHALYGTYKSLEEILNTITAMPYITLTETANVAIL